MKRLLVLLGLMIGSLQLAEARSHQNTSYGSWDTGTGSNAQSERVSGYEKKDGTYVEPYYRTKANDTVNDNYETRGNVNPYNGKVGTGGTDYDRQSGSIFDTRPK